MTQSVAEIPPVPLGRHTLQAAVVIQQMHEHAIQLLIEQLTDGGERMPQQRRSAASACS